MRYSAHLFSLFIFLLSSSLQGQESLQLQQIMTPQERAATGVDSLSSKHKQALEHWLQEWSLKILEQGQVPIPTSPVGDENTSSSHPRDSTFVIDQAINHGESLKLEDGTLWKVAPKYRAQTRSWQRGQSVVLSRNHKAGYSHQLFNLDYGVAVEVWQISDKDLVPSKPQQEEKAFRVDQVIRNGERIKLEDGSSWEILPADRLEAQAWLPKDRVKIERSGNALYPQRLVNVEHNESIEAKFLSK